MRDVELVPAVPTGNPFLLPLFSCTVPASFPSPATDHLGDELFDLNRLLVRHPDATYLVRLSGESMGGAEIYTGDLLAVDKQMETDHGHIVVAVVEGECTFKQFAYQILFPHYYKKVHMLTKQPSQRAVRLDLLLLTTASMAKF